MSVYISVSQSLTWEDLDVFSQEEIRQHILFLFKMIREGRCHPHFEIFDSNYGVLPPPM